MALAQPLYHCSVDLEARLAQKLMREHAAAHPILQWMRDTDSSMPSASSARALCRHRGSGISPILTSRCHAAVAGAFHA
ncbi:MAG TPA: hypothetical protein VEZ88_00670 [Steroidobacteraceae bacterium]|nr:hypothetical protein [Steroidobacteraceae bacterium]